MYKFSVPERIIHKLHGYMKPLYAKYYQSKLNNTGYTIISDNCWGGIVYEWFGLEKLSPTVGCYFLRMIISRYSHHAIS